MSRARQQRQRHLSCSYNRVRPGQLTAQHSDVRDTSCSTVSAKLSAWGFMSELCEASCQSSLPSCLRWRKALCCCLAALATRANLGKQNRRGSPAAQTLGHACGVAGPSCCAVAPASNHDLFSTNKHEGDSSCHGVTTPRKARKAKSASLPSAPVYGAGWEASHNLR